MRVAIFEVLTSFLIFPSIYNKTGVHHTREVFFDESLGTFVSKNKQCTQELLTKDFPAYR